MHYKTQLNVPNELQITALNGNCCGVVSIIKLTFATIDVPNNDAVSIGMMTFHNCLMHGHMRHFQRRDWMLFSLFLVFWSGHCVPKQTNHQISHQIPVGLFTQDDISHAFISSKSILGLPPFDVACAVVRVVVFKMSKEVFEWLRSTSNGLNLERLAKEFEVRGLLTRQSLKYIQTEDLDTFFPSPQKLLLAERHILKTEINNLKEPNLPPRELFPPVQDCRQAYPSVATQF